jgi:hypothetical protein
MEGSAAPRRELVNRDSRVNQQELLNAQNQPPEQPIDPEETHPVDGVALRRLLAVATLTPAQAGLLALDLVEALEAAGSDGRGPEHIDDRSTIVTEDGRLALLPEAAPADGVQVPRQRQATEDATSLTRRLIANARKSGARPPAGATLLTDRVGGSFDDLPDLARRVRRAVAEVLPLDDPEQVDRVRRQLAALAAATKGNPPVQNGDPFAVKEVERRPDIPLKVSRAAVLTREDWRRVSRPVWHRKRRLTSRRTVVIALVVVLVGALAWWIVPGGIAQLDRGWDAMFGTAEPSQRFAPVSPPPGEQRRVTGSPESAGERPGPVKSFGPRQAAPITEVTVERAQGPCSPGEVCAVRVDVHLSDVDARTEVEWTLRIVDRCSGEVRRARGGVMTADAGSRQVYAVGRPDLRTGKALAVVAVTTEPVRVASAPLLVPSAVRTC